MKKTAQLKIHLFLITMNIFVNFLAHPFPLNVDAFEALLLSSSRRDTLQCWIVAVGNDPLTFRERLGGAHDCEILWLSFGFQLIHLMTLIGCERLKKSTDTLSYTSVLHS